MNQDAAQKSGGPRQVAAAAVPAISVLAVEDDFVMRRQLLSRLAEGATLQVQVAASLAEGLELLVRNAFDIVLVDLGLPDGSGIKLIEAAVLPPKPARVLVLSALRDEASVVAAISAGADGYVVKDASAQDILEAVHNLASGFSPLSPSIARFLLRHFRREDASTELSSKPRTAFANHPLGLTARESDVLLHITRGASYKQIAQSLVITEGTVQTHIKNVYRKLGVSNRSEAAYMFSQFSEK